MAQHFETTNAAPGASKTSIVTCPTGHEYQLVYLNVCASDGNAGTVDLIHYQTSDATEYTFKKAAVVPAADSYSITSAEFGPKAVLREGDILKATPSRTAQHISVTYLVIRKNDPGIASRS